MNELRRNIEKRAGIAEMRDAVQRASDFFREITLNHDSSLRVTERGIVTAVQRGIVTVTGLPHVWSDEVLKFAGNRRGFASNLDRDTIGCVLLDEGSQLQAGGRVERTRRVVDTPVGDELLGRVIDPIGRPLDGGRWLKTTARRPCERNAPSIMRRAPVTVPLQTGIKVIDALIPIGRGQRQLILGDRQTGKTSIAVDTMINQRGRDVICVYCSIGQRSTNVARVIAKLREHHSLGHSIIVVGADNAPPGLQFVAPYAATSIGEYFMEQGRDVLVIYDDLSTHARAYRHISLLLRRPPGREAFPGDIFYVHSRLLERSTHLRDDAGGGSGGSMTALPIVETEAQNVSAYIPTNLISITDGQIFLSPKLYHKNILPAVDVGRSVSRVGRKAQLPAYRAVAGELRLTYSQFEEVEKFARFSSQLDQETRKTLRRGQRIRETLKQSQYATLGVPEQIASLLAVKSGLFDSLDVNNVRDAESIVQREMAESFGDLSDRISKAESLQPNDIERLVERFRDVLSDLVEQSSHHQE